MSYKKKQKLKGKSQLDILEISGTSTYQEMDKLFQNYCKEQSLKSKTTTNGARRSIHFARALSGTNFAKVQNPKPLEATTPVNRKSLVEQNSIYSINQDKNDNHGISNNGGDDNFVSKMHSLTLKPNNGTWNLSDDELNQIAQEFGLSISLLLSLNTQEEKHKYIVDCMRKAVNDDLREFNKKHHAKVSHHTNFDAEYLKNKEKLENDNADIFSWLHIQTRHEPLKKKLRSRLAETINDQENQNIIETNLEEIRNSPKEISRSSSLLKKIRLENIPVIDNIEILQGMLDGKSDNLLKMTKGVKHANRNLDSTQTSNAPAKETSVSIVHQDKPADVDPETLKEWDPSKEETFLQYREDAKSRLFDKIKSSNWNELGFSPLVQASVKDEKSKLQRDTKLASYMNGDLLTPEEYKLLASTSVTLNKFVDKKYLQTVVNYLDPEVVEAIETDLAENTLKDYEKRQKDMRNARLSYIKEHNKSLAQSIERKNHQMEAHIRVAQGKQEQMKIKRRALSMLSKVEERKKWRENFAKANDQDIKSPLSKDVDIEHFADKFLKVVDQKVANRKFQKAQNFLKRLLPYQQKQNPIDVEASRHYFHPASKIIVKNNNRSNDYLGLGTDNLNPAIAKRKNDKVDDFKLHIHSSPVLKINRNFKRFYSGGPEDDDMRVFQGNYIIGDLSTFKIDKAQERIVLKIQAAWRGYMQRKAFRQVQEKVKERNRTQGRMGYLKNNSSSPFLKTVLSAQDKFSLKRLKSKGNETDFVKEKQISLSNLSPSSKVLDSGHRNSKASHDLKMILHNDLERLHKAYQSPANRLDSNPKSLENLDGFPRKETTTKLAKINESHEFSKALARPKTAMMSPTNALARLPKNSGHNTPKPPKDFEADSLLNVDMSSDDANRLSKIVKRGAPKGLLLKQRKLFIAAKTNNYNLILSSGFNYYEADVNTKDEQGNSPLFYAARNGSKDVCEFLVRHKAYVNEPCSNGNTPLHMAFSSGQIMVVILLISYGGNLNVLNQQGQTPVAFGSETLLSLLDLKDATATFNNHYVGGKQLPSELDNNRFLKRFQSKLDTDLDQLSFDYKTLDNNLGKIGSESKKR